MSADSYAAAWLSELWAVCREESRDEREVKRALDAAFAQPVERVTHKSTGAESAGEVTKCA